MSSLLGRILDGTDPPELYDLSADDEALQATLQQLRSELAARKAKTLAAAAEQPATATACEGTTGPARARPTIHDAYPVFDGAVLFDETAEVAAKKQPHGHRPTERLGRRARGLGCFVAACSEAEGAAADAPEATDGGDGAPRLPLRWRRRATATTKRRRTSAT